MEMASNRPDIGKALLYSNNSDIILICVIATGLD